MKLYEIKEAYLTLDKFIDDNELSREDFKQALDEIEGSLEEKIEGYIKYMKNLEGESAIFKAEEKRVKARKQALENQIERLKSAIDETLKAVGIKDMKTPLFSLKYQKNPPSVEVLDEELIPENYKLPQKIELDKAAILQDLKNGIEIEGVAITTGENLRIR